ncbi:stage II sporulation protein M [Paenibacillus sp. J31TS4]|uniref:stage II sporulation protein M n=1 Tax=Paenibacillus sp. J31TS4 TaxID=2807195 RepID=UPI001B2B63F4|nr:stage II sporulation protein M [Paenibacillus sp. J31TS4]GIP37558.1 stage II sporulation protein M [Paenibacillus sp. J31TS4]
MPKPSGLFQREPMSYYLFVGALFLTGVVFGSVMVNALTLEQKEEIARHLGGFFDLVTLGTGFDAKQSFFDALGMNLKWVVLIWLLGLSVIGMPLIFALDFLKGVLIGFTVGYLVGTYSWKGMLFALVSVAPQNLIAIPVILAASAGAMSFSILLVRNRFWQRGGSVYASFLHYSSGAMVLALLMIGVSLFEAMVSPVMMKWVTPFLQG